MGFEEVKAEKIKTLERKASFYLKNGDVISAQSCLAQIRVIAGASKNSKKSEKNRVVGVNYK